MNDCPVCITILFGQILHFTVLWVTSLYPVCIFGIMSLKLCNKLAMEHYLSTNLEGCNNMKLVTWTCPVMSVTSSKHQNDAILESLNSIECSTFIN